MAREVPEGIAGYSAIQTLWNAVRKKIASLKTSEIDNDGDGTSPFATQAYVETNGGKIDKIKVNNVEQTITDKTVNISVPSIAAKGSATRPVYISATDVATPCTYGFGIDSTGPYIESF